MGPAFRSHDHRIQLVAGGLAGAFSERGELCFEVTFDTALLDPEVYLYVDLLDGPGTRRAHTSIRIADRCIVLNTLDNGVWGEAVTIAMDFSSLRHWRLWLVVQPDGSFSVRLGGVTLCACAFRLPPRDVVRLASNVSATCALAPSEAETGGVIDHDAPGGVTALIHLALAPEAQGLILDGLSLDELNLGGLTLDFFSADRRLDLAAITPFAFGGQRWLACRFAEEDAALLARSAPLRLILAGGESLLRDVLAAPVVEISPADVVLRQLGHGTDPASAEAVVWADPAGPARTETRLVATEAQGPGFTRFITPLSELLRLVPPLPGRLVLELQAGGAAQDRARLHRHQLPLGPEIYPALADLARHLETPVSAEWQMVLLDWWSVLHRPEQQARLARTAPFLAGFLRDQRQFVGTALQLDAATQAALQDPTPPPPAPPVPEVIALWRALRSVDALLADPATDRAGLERHVLALAGVMRPDSRHYFLLELACPLLAQGLGEIVTTGIAEEFIADLLAEGRSSWQLSSALAPLAARGRFADCALVLERLTASGGSSFNAAAIAAAVIGALTARQGQALKNRVAYCFLDFLKSFGARDYTGFRHADLITALIRTTLMAADGPDWYQADLLAFVEQHYASLPEFWTTYRSLRGAARNGLFLDRFDAIAASACARNEALAGVRAIPEVQGNPGANPSSSAGRDLLLAGASGERHYHLATFLQMQGLAGPESRAPLTGAALTSAALCEDPLLRAAAHPFAGALPDSLVAAVPPQALREAVLRLQGFPQAEYRSLLETVGRAVWAGDIDRLCDFIPLCSAGGPTPDAATNAVVLDAITWGLLAQKREGILLSAVIVHIHDGLRLAPDPAAVPPALHAAVRRLVQAAAGAGLDGDMDPLTLRQIATLEEVYRNRFPAALPEAAPPAAAASGFFADTLVALITCRKYLTTRAQECRETWIRDIEEAGAKVLYFCGSDDSHGVAEFDEANGIVTLPVGDAYEDLPAKVLAIFRWIRAHRPEAYVLKIDDDCYLDAQTFLTSLSYRRSHYFGRPLTAFPSTFDRAWHQGKSARPGNQRAIDTSPLGTRYADGGGSYVLSRFALDRLDDVADSGLGLRLRLASYFEDKMIGDLLQAGGIEVSNIGYTSMQARRTHSGALPVLQVDRTFVPGPQSGIAVAHLDQMGLMAQIRAGRDQDQASGGLPRLWPPRIWPMNVKPSLAYESNMLEMLNPVGARQKIAAADFVCVCALRNEMTILPHFLAHYRALGVDVFLIADNLSDDGTREYLHGQPDVVLFSAANEYRASHYGVDWQRVLLDHFCAGRWVVVADADEFLLGPETHPGALRALCRSLEAEGHDAAIALMADMYPEGALEEADFTRLAPAEVACSYDRMPVRRWSFNRGPFGNLASYVSGLRHRLMPLSPPERFTAQKVALFRFNPLMSFSEGFHFGTGLRVAPQALAFLHYKYSAEFAAKARLEATRGQHYGGGVEYRAYLDLVEQGLTSLWRPGISETLDLTSPGALERLLDGVEPLFRG